MARNTITADDLSEAATEPVARAMIDLEIARTDAEQGLVPSTATLDNVSHWIQEIAAALNIDLAEAMADYDPTPPN